MIVCSVKKHSEHAMRSGNAAKEELEDLQANKQRRQLEDTKKAAENKQGGPVLG